MSGAGELSDCLITAVCMCFFFFLGGLGMERADEKAACLE